MPIQVQGPDGQEYEFPDGTSRDMMKAAMAKRYAPTKPDFSNVRGGVGPTVRDQSKLGMGERLAAGVASAPADAILALSEMTGIGTDAWRKQTKANIDAARSTTAGKVGGFAGEVGMYALPAAKVAKLGRAAQFAGSMGLGGAAGALHATGGDESRLRNIAIGAGAGLAGQAGSEVLTASAGRAAQAIPALKREMAGVAQKYNIPLHVSQLTNSVPAKVAASTAKYLPFTGAAKQAAKQQDAWNDALSVAMGNQRGIARPLSDDAMKATAGRIGGMYDDVYARNNVVLDDQAVTNMTRIYNDALSEMGDDNAGIVRKQFDKLINNFADGQVAGKKYQDLRSKLGKVAANTPGAAGDALRQLRKELDAAAQRSVSGADGQAIKTANSQYANYATVRDALKQAGGASENVAPGNLWNLVRDGSTQEMRDLARLGKSVLQDPIPDSGTAGRSLMQMLMTGGAGGAYFTGGASMAPAALHAGAGVTLGRAMNSPYLARLMLRDNPGALRALMGQELARPAGIAAGFPFMREPEQP